MKNRQMTCIQCPVGCTLSVDMDGQGKILSISGNKCKRGPLYAEKEIKDPRRSVSSTILIEGSKWPSVSVKTSPEIPKDMIFPVMKEIRAARVKAPIHMGDILIKNVAGTDSDIVATEDRLD